MGRPQRLCETRPDAGKAPAWPHVRLIAAASAGSFNLRCRFWQADTMVPSKPASLRVEHRSFRDATNVSCADRTDRRAATGREHFDALRRFALTGHDRRSSIVLGVESVEL